MPAVALKAFKKNNSAVACSLDGCFDMHVYMQGGGPFNLYSTDMEGIFRQAALKHLPDGSG